MKIISKEESEKWFSIFLESMNNAYKDAMKKGDVKAINGLTAMDISEKWAVANTGSYFMSWMYKETLKNYSIGGEIPSLSYGKLVHDLRKRKISPARVAMIKEALEQNGFIETNIKKIKSIEGYRTILRLKLTDIWKPILRSYIRTKKNTTFPYVLGRQIYLSYLAEQKNSGLSKLATGISSFKAFLIVLNNITPEGNFDNEQGERMFENIGGSAIWHSLGEMDSTRMEEIKFFIEDNGKTKKINPNVIWAYNKYLIPNVNKNMNMRGMSL